MRGATPVILRARADALFLGHHALFELIQNREKFTRSLFNVGHRRLKLIRRVEAAQVVRGSATNMADIIGT